jgi:hypothetical protein
LNIAEPAPIASAPAAERYVYYVLPEGKAIRYGAIVGEDAQVPRGFRGWEANGRLFFQVAFFHMDAKGSVAQLLAFQAHLGHGSNDPRFSILPNGRVLSVAPGVRWTEDRAGEAKSDHFNGGGSPLLRERARRRAAEQRDELAPPADAQRLR